MARGARLALSGVVAASVVALVVFHAALFWSQAGDGRLLDPLTATRWMIGALLCLALLALHRAGVPVLWGRRALVVWVLVALLHWTAAPGTDLADVAGAGGSATQVLIDLPVGAAGILAAVMLSLLLLLAGSLRLSRARSMMPRRPGHGPARAPLLSRHLASRAPPDLLA